jgi:hypothetical protein
MIDISKENLVKYLKEIDETGQFAADTTEKRVFLNTGFKYFNSKGFEKSRAFHGTEYQGGLSLTDFGKSYLINNQEDSESN